MSQQHIEKTTTAGVTFSCIETSGKIDESEIPSDGFESHYLFPGDTKSESSYQVVGGDGCLYRENVESAYEVGASGEGVTKKELYKRLRKLNDEFSNPPLTEEQLTIKESFEKHAEVAKFDSERNVVVGACMVPNRADKQNDFERPATIRKLSDGYMEALASGASGNKVMHAVEASDDSLTHVENRVLDKAEEIGGKTFPAGSWIVGKRVKDDTLKSLIEKNVLNGFSIGGHIHAAKEYDAGSVPSDVEVDKSNEGPVREITAASIHEISLVDSPAVQDAEILTAKADGDGFAKADDRLTAGVDTATNYLVEERGHSESDAEELAMFLNQTGKSATVSGGDESATWLSKAKRFFTRRETSHDDHEMTDDKTEKQGRTLNSDNVNRAMALHDIAIDMLDGTDVSQNRLRFSDDRSVPDFSLDEFESKAVQTTDGRAESRSDADTTDSTMSNTELKEMLKSIKETQEEQAERMDALEADGEEKAEDDDDPVLELAETVESLADQQEQILERIENAEGASQQTTTATTSTDEGVSKADVLGLPSMEGT